MGAQTARLVDSDMLYRRYGLRKAYIGDEWVCSIEAQDE